jgi:hypothetical protein
MKDPDQRGRRRSTDDSQECDREPISKRKQVARDEREEFEEWRRERSGRGRKKKGKAGGRHERRSRGDD